MFNFILIIFSIFVIGCDQKPQTRHYSEITIDADTALQTMPGGAGQFLWDVPSGWTQELGGNMRLATFRLVSNPEAFDCSIVSLPGGAGGLEANLKRWMAQINLNVSDSQFTQFISMLCGARPV